MDTTGNLQNICNTVISNLTAASKMYKLDYISSYALFGITNAGKEVNPDKLAESMQILKENVKGISVFDSSAPRMLSVSKMNQSSDPLYTFNKIKENYETMSKIYGKNSFVGGLSALLIDYQGDFSLLASRSKEILDLMIRKHHFIGISYKDYLIMTLMAASDKSVEDLMKEAEAIFESIKKDFKFSKDEAYTLSYLLSVYAEQTDWKAKAALALREDLKRSKIKFSGYSSISILAPLTAASLRTDRHVLVCDIADADKYFASQKVIGGIFGLSETIRRMLAATCVIKAIGEDDAPFSTAEYLTVMSCMCQIKSQQDSTAATI